MATGSYVTTATLKTRAGIPDSTDDTLLGVLCDEINDLIEDTTGRVLAPVASATYLFDGDGSAVLRYPRGIRAVSLLEVAASTGAAYTTVNSSDYFLRPHSHLNRPGWPALRIELSDSGSQTFFPVGLDTVRVTMTTGWAATPDVIEHVAITTAVRAWHARQSGQVDIVGSDESGAPIVSRFVAPDHWRILRRYTDRADPLS